jgi:hypothetical protein
VHPTLRRLDDLARRLGDDPHVIAVLGLGSAGVETERFDDHSDIDFFVVLDSGEAKQGYLDDVAWLDGFGGELAWSFVNSVDGRKALFADGLFVEYAVFTADELPCIPFVGARVAWSRDGWVLPEGRTPGPPALDSPTFHVDEALSNLFVGLHRELRGERLTAMRFIQVYAVDHLLALERLSPAASRVLPDAFEPTRRVERGSSDTPLPLAGMVQGYAANAVSAEATLGWLTEHHPCDSAIVRPIRELIAAASRSEHRA